MRPPHGPNPNLLTHSHPPHARFLELDHGTTNRSPSVPLAYIQILTTPSSSQENQALRTDQAVDDGVFAFEAQQKYLEQARYDTIGHDAALQIQQQYDDEDKQLRAQVLQLMAAATPTFECGVCMDTLPEDVIARFEQCDHVFCRYVPAWYS